ncbi:hypothetical protein N657DRAFT_490904 [Parathielavia appendiculata]|uniref:Uncharacterized protein n=1 Tax=Parathielavia appendiculata TaxID=2587402 RepID=A0AAN6Z1H2_9PEZI|nr:hypothetical protein N657DRAFT_490904 [Parathielavia appendiculata]
MTSRSNLWTSIKWSFRKSSIRGSFPEMENVKTTLDLLVATVHSEATAKAVQFGGRRLRQTIKHHVDALEELQIQLSDARRLSGSMSAQSSISELKLHETLTELGLSIYLRSVVPDPAQPPLFAYEDKLQVRTRPHAPLPRQRRPEESIQIMTTNSHSQTTSLPSSRHFSSPVRQPPRVSRMGPSRSTSSGLNLEKRGGPPSRPGKPQPNQHTSITRGSTSRRSIARSPNPANQSTSLSRSSPSSRPPLDARQLESRLNLNSKAGR